ncbi:MAG: tRNA (N6-threonylcarbamoyladenosine(37)-N6)-methyltransferase TrmO [Blautia sp.]|nr:tRNA (N6-threonylcarbamoyladenosine(37)-N6)-methyltransferase TrmO [Blautia sp.]
MKVIAHIESSFPTKFGIPHQSGKIDALKARIVFEPPYRNREALRGLEEFSHIWLIWEFSEARRDDWSPTVRPPRLGGNRRMGVFATRSPFRPNPIGLSSVRLEGILQDKELGPVLLVAGADLMDGTPIYDIKPYIHSDCHPDAAGGFTDHTEMPHLSVHIPPELSGRVPEEQREALLEVLSSDPRPRYQKDPDRVYGMPFAGLDVRFRVREGSLEVVDIIKFEPEDR